MLFITRLNWLHWCRISKVFVTLTNRKCKENDSAKSEEIKKKEKIIHCSFADGMACMGAVSVVLFDAPFFYAVNYERYTIYK